MLRAAGWILLAVALARGLAQLAALLPAPESGNLLGLLLRPDPASYDPAAVGLTDLTGSAAFAATCALGLGGVLARAAATWGQQVLARRAALGAKEELRHALVRHRLAAAGAEADRAGEDAVLAATGLDGLDAYFTQYLPALLSAAVVPLALGAWILAHDLVSALVLALTLPLVPLFMVLIGRYTEDRVQQAAAGLDRLSHHLLELARGLPVLVGLRRAGTQRQALAGVSERYRSTTLTTLRTAFLSGFALELISTLSVAVVAVVIGVRLVDGQVDLYTGLLVLTLAPEVYLPFRDIGAAHHASEDGVEALRRARAETARPVPASLADREALADGPDGSAGTETDDADRVRVRGLSLAHRGPDGAPGPAVVEGLDLDLEPGRTTVLAGSSGTGKTTVLSALAGVQRAGRLHARGTTRGLAGRPVAWLGQHPQASEPTVRAELALHAAAGATVDGTVDDALTGAALAACGLAGTEDRDPAEMSPGERRRLGMARVLARLMAAAGATAGAGDERAWLVVLDEPTAHLDPAGAERIRSVIGELAAGRLPGGRRTRAIVLVASHDRALHRRADVVHGPAPDPGGPGAASRPDSVAVATGTTVSADRPVGLTGAAGEAVGQDAAPADPGTAAGPVSADAAATGGLPAGAPRGDGPGWRAWLRLLPLTERRFLAGVAWAVAATLAAALLSGLSGWLIVQAAYQPPVLYLLSVIVMVRFLGIGRALARYLERLRTHDAVLDWAGRLRLRLWDRLGSHAGQWGRLTRSGGALSVLVADVDELRDAVPRVIVPIPAAVLSWAATVLVVALMAPAAWWPPVVAGAAGLVLVPLVVGAADRRATRALADHRTGLLRRTTALFTAAADLGGNGAAALAAERFAAADRAADRPLQRAAAAAGLGQALAVLLSGWAAVQAMVLCLAHGVTAPVAALVVFLLLALAEPLGLYATAWQEAAVLRRQLAKTAPLLAGPAPDGAASDGRAFDGTAPDGPGAPVVEAGPVDPAGAAGPHRPGTARVTGLRLEGVAARYPGTGRDVLTGVDLAASRDGLAVITGPSGSGKSTLLAVLLGFLPPHAGRYVLQSSAPAAPAQALRRVAWCPQDAHLFDSTLRANLALARDPGDRPSEAEMRAALALVGLGGWLGTRPAGLDTRLGPAGHHLSGGQRQRVAVARALLARADVVLLDEPTAHLGADEAAALVADLRHALRGRTAVMVTHDERFAAAGTTGLRLGAGRP
ncbi:thiol reductant ABC exporter subunit CydC [Citricoccus sp. SGAir0253]|uniref:thiol reductant ABC exporter subunit CydC n=1 Tax=Citricoccus sp. SGAir0253 TaxID=2567881 RepID=UPI00143DFF6B|nr:thiol reductant ABC exporter subunit CydC [Citricoccus sp. SGAir0253]